MAVLGAPVFHHGNLAFFVAIFSEMTRLSAGVGLRLHSIHPSITRESKWRYIMKKINLRELYPDVYTTDFFVDVTEEVMALKMRCYWSRKHQRYFWRKNSFNDSDFSKYLFHYDYAAQQTGFVQPYADSPMDNEQVGEEVYISMINKAEKYCWFMTPYLIITDEMTHEK